ncbi:MAG TPA: 16S rRNA (uracil(1498)-N(3))-methyltransferase [Nitrospiraceae bacterium]|nr:16S rRNA (uracil(1498)-N(3))-methyltransferase [Nitrospiraceae bacterium]
MPAFFIDSRDLCGQSATITGELFHHLRASLRLQRNDHFHLTDERRRRHRAVVTEVTHNQLTARIIDTVEGPTRLYPSLILGQAILKGEHMDWIVQKAGELGVETIVPLVTRHTIVRPRPARVDSQTTRWRRIAREAAQQSEQWHIPAVQPPCEAAEFFTQTKAAGRLVLVERAQAISVSDVPVPTEPAASLIIAVGPEGGWQADEAAMAREHGFQPVTLGPMILRSETASLAALAILQSRLGLLR